MNSFCLLIAEAWVCSALSTEKLADHRPGVKEKQTEPAVIHYASCNLCRRKVIMDYCGDMHPDGNYFRLGFPINC